MNTKHQRIDIKNSRREAIYKETLEYYEYTSLDKNG